MKAIHYAPGIGMPIALHDIIESDQPFAVKAQQAVLVGLTQGAITIVGMNTNIIAARKAQAYTRVGLALATSPVTIPAALFVGLVAYTGMNEPSRTDASLNIPYRSMSRRHHGNPYLS